MRYTDFLAEAEACLALNGMRDISAAHNLLGILLIERGAAADALSECANR